jgi:hypothetical protein
MTSQRYAFTMTNQAKPKQRRNRPSGAITLSPQFLAWAKANGLEHVDQTLRDLERFRKLKTYSSESRERLDEKRQKTLERLRAIEEALKIHDGTG